MARFARALVSRPCRIPASATSIITILTGGSTLTFAQPEITASANSTIHRWWVDQTGTRRLSRSGARAIPHTSENGGAKKPGPGKAMKLFPGPTVEYAQVSLIGPIRAAAV